MDLNKVDKRLLKKLNSPRWRLNNLYWIQPEQGGKIKFKMNVVQTLFFVAMWWLNVVLKSRQHGMSTLINLMQLDQCLFNEDQTAGIIDKTDPDAKKKLEKIKYAYDHLDDPDDTQTAPLGAAIKEAVKMVAPTNAHEITFSNRSKIWSGTSLRGGTIQFLHISELGPIAFHFPAKAEEIRSGSLNTVHKNCKVCIESTHEGGKYGLNYEMINIAMSSPEREEMSVMDWQFHFFAWWQDPKNTLDVGSRGLMLTVEQREYFDELMENEGIDLSDEQKHWYVKKLATQKDAMSKEHPSTAEEALNAAIKGAIYGKIISKLKKDKRVVDFVHDQTAPLYTFWDLGKSDYMSIWLVQFTGREYSILNYYSMTGEDARFYVAKIREWEREYGFISKHFMPHDVDNDGGPGLTWRQAFEKAGLEGIVKVPRTPDVWIGIRHLRSLLPRCWIHKSNCSVQWKITGEVILDGSSGIDEIIPSGLSCLEGYRTKTTEANAVIQEMPVHDQTSHGADGLRTFAEAHQRGMLTGHTPLEQEARRVAKTKVLRGVGNRTEVRKTLTRKPKVRR